MTSTDDTSGLGRRDFVRVGAGAVAAGTAAASTASAQEDGADGDQEGDGQEGEEDQEGGDENAADESTETAQEDGEAGDEEQPPAQQTGTDVLALFGVAAVLAFLSPVALVVLMYRHSRREEEQF